MKALEKAFLIPAALVIHRAVLKSLGRSFDTSSVAARIVCAVLSLWILANGVLAFRDASQWWVGVILSFFSVAVNITTIAVIAYIWHSLSMRRKRRHLRRFLTE